MPPAVQFNLSLTSPELWQAGHRAFDLQADLL
jgi:hypothetical protein